MTFLTKFHKLSAIAAVIAAAMATATASAQTLFDEMIIDGETVNADTISSAPSRTKTSTAPATESAAASRARRAQKAAMRRRDAQPSLWDLTDANGVPLDPANFGPQELVPDSTLDVSDMSFPDISFLPLIFDSYSTGIALRNPDPLDPDSVPPVELNWAERAVYRDKRVNAFIQNFMIANPQLVRYNLASMPRPPKEYRMEADPSQAKITVTEFVRDRKEMTSVAKPVELEHINWLQNFDGSMQFSQAYVSPNWYQGGKSNLNAILSLLYNVKLNPKFYPNLIFETNIQYRLGLNNAPDDTVHAYNISEDLLQVNTKFGVKAARRWFYSLSGQFKTQLLNNYRMNSEELQSAALSPGELNLGVGMTYNYENRRKTFQFDATISALSYNLKMCTNSRLKPTSFGIEEGHKTISDYGSSTEMTLHWKLAYNIKYDSRMFIFTNYEYVQGDWENTFTFTINKFLETKLYGHLRYQSDAEPREDTRWHKWQFKEILSIGFSYKFSRS